METIVYKPFAIYRFFGWLMIVLAVVLICTLHFIALFALPFPITFAVLFLHWGKVTVILGEEGIRLQHESTAPERFIPWEQLQYYRLDNNLRGLDVLILSSSAVTPEKAKTVIQSSEFSHRLWFDGVLVIPLHFSQKQDAVRKLAYQKCVHK